MNRNTWRFQYQVTDLLAAVNIKVSFHKERLAKWQDTMERVKKEAKEEGLVVNESLASSVYNNSTKSSGFGPTIEIPYQIQQKLNEADMKIKEHAGKLAGYLAWEEVLNVQPDNKTLELDHEDFFYFFGVG